MQRTLGNARGADRCSSTRVRPPQILAEYAARCDWIEVMAKLNRGARAMRPDVIEAFYFGLDRVRMEAGPLVGTCSGSYMRVGNRLIFERCGD